MTEGENVLLSVPEYTEVIKRELSKILKNDQDKLNQFGKLAEVFADFDRNIVNLRLDWFTKEYRFKQ